VLINFYGIHVLTDPALSTRVGISIGIGTAGAKRHVAPALSFKELPSVDLVLLSHAHMDHMDLPTLGKIARHSAVVTASATKDVLSSTKLSNVTELRWNDSLRFANNRGDLDIKAVEVKHWGARWPSEVPRGYNGYILRREGKAILFGGDTAMTPLFSELRSQGPFEVALMPIGAYQPWIWNHCNPEQAVAMANAARARYLIPIHHSTFRLSEEPMDEPIQRLELALATEPERVALRKQGETFILPKT
jgi:L-ascorbate metabolism protein UlaG (beta-lactamase superfamily)